MEITSVCAVIATLTVLPNRSQFFLYESFSLSCGQQGNSSDWRVKRNTSTTTNGDCLSFSDKGNYSDCFIEEAYPMDAGVYWCESGAGACSNTINISVTAGSVILESPVLPVTEGDDVTLRCRNITSSSNPTADFYKDDVFIRSSSTGNMTIHSVSEADEGLYRCNISAAGQSTGSWLRVRARRPDPPQSSLACILLPVVGFCLLLVSVMLHFLWRL
ncbi:low affinity immunoglobulin gamma Fc region receptor II-b-like [Seriola lalandi dorsalis]|uniref:low affinity immunoglobulin gamma Fc region receptor II-b-like n=1 Tax=Seriola lalandi dorsalis TaxID=1841481 RepID=UPI000C6F65DE|nr:low affinity immunoglobulin gamma Fc region receptor II-b-like [Seriola lalandi dorsalis]